MKWLALALSALIALGSLMAWVGGISADAADIKRRVDTLEKRQEEDRRDVRESVKVRGRT